jgi:hypothetical protein
VFASLVGIPSALGILTPLKPCAHRPGVGGGATGFVFVCGGRKLKLIVT